MTPATSAAEASPTREQVELAIGGMTCASCAARIEKKLNKLEGVNATVNFASEHAAVAFDPGRVSLDQVIGAVEAAGYQASLPEAAAAEDPARLYLSRLILAVVLTVPLMVLSWAPGARPPGWEWVSLAVATLVVFWAGWPFHRAAMANARHGAASMDTLISVGTLAAWLWSAVVLTSGISTTVYFDTAGAITTLILVGRYLEARAKRRSGDAIRSLLELGAKEARVLKDGAEVLVPVGQLAVGGVFVVRPGDKIVVANVDGRTTTWTVASNPQVMSKAALARLAWPTSGPPYLALVTCGGPFDYSTGHYLDNVVVYASPAA